MIRPVSYTHLFKNLEGHCDVIKSEPSTQDIEDEKFEKDFTIVVVSHESLDEVISIIKSVSEIKTAEGKAITVPFQEVNDAPAEEEKKMCIRDSDISDSRIC